MAVQITHGAQVITLAAGADLTGSQQLFVKVNGSGQAVPVSAATDNPVGVLLNNPAQGFEALVAVSGQIKVISSAAIAAGAVLGTDATGKAITIVPGTDSTKYQVGRALESSAAAGVVITALIDTLIPGRAA